MAIFHQREADLRRVKEAGIEAAVNIYSFAVHVASIHSAIDAGEDIRIPPDSLKTLEDAFHLLIPRRPTKKAPQREPQRRGRGRSAFQSQRAGKSEPDEGAGGPLSGALAGGVKLLICLAKLRRSPPQIVKSILVRRAS